MAQRSLLICADALVNLGDLALLRQGIMLGKSSGREVYVRQWSIPPDLIAEQVREFGGVIVPGKRLLAVVKLARRCDAVIGGGQIVRDNVTVVSLLYLFLTLIVVRLGGGKVSTWGLGISRVKRSVLRLLWRRILALSDSVRVRDDLSAENAKKLVLGAKLLRTADLAFIPGDLHEQLRSFSLERRTILIAPCIEASENRSIDGPGFPILLSGIRERLPEADVVLACHDPRPEIDGGAADVLIQKYGIPAESKLSDGNLGTLCAAYRHAAIVVTNRLHASIFALLAGTPLIIIDDGSGKMRALSQLFKIDSIEISRIIDRSAIDQIIQDALNVDASSRSTLLQSVAAIASANRSALA